MFEENARHDPYEDNSSPHDTTKQRQQPLTSTSFQNIKWIIQGKELNKFEAVFVSTTNYKLGAAKS